MQEMEDKSTLDTAKKEFYFFVIPFSLITAGTYHLAFWSTFEINIFPYFQVTEILTSVIYPILLFAGVGVGAGVLKHYYYPNTPSQKETIYEKLNKTPAFSILFPSLYLWIIFLVYMYCGVIIKWLILMALLFPVVLTPFFSVMFDSKLVPKFFPKSLALMIMMPMFAFGIAKVKSKCIYYDDTFEEVKIESFKSLHLTSSQMPLKYLGQAGSYCFFLTYDNKEKLIIPVGEMNGLFLVHPDPKKIKKTL